MSAAITTARRLWLGLALAATGAAGSAPGAEQPIPFEVRAEGSFPLQYIETLSGRSPQHTLTGAPFLGLTTTASLQSDLNVSIFVEGGHSPLGSFRDNDDTFASAGGNIVKRWGALSAGVGYERTQYYDGVFGERSNLANDLSLFGRYVWRPSPDLRIIAGANVTTRLDDAFALQRTSTGVRFDIERRLLGAWWAVVAMRVRYSDYAGEDAGRRDVRLAVVGGLKYEFNESVSARMLAGYEDRTSNFAGRSAEKFSVGASLDFNVDLLRPRWPAER